MVPMAPHILDFPFSWVQIHIHHHADATQHQEMNWLLNQRLDSRVVGAKHLEILHTEASLFHKNNLNLRNELEMLKLPEQQMHNIQRLKRASSKSNFYASLSHFE